MLFDYQRAAKRAGIAEEKLGRLRRQIREDFPHDEMMFELHMLRAILAVERGDASIDEILGSVTVP